LIDVTKKYPLCNELCKMGSTENITMPRTLLERDSRTQKIKLQKIFDSRSRGSGGGGGGRSSKGQTTAISTTSTNGENQEQQQQHNDDPPGTDSTRTVDFIPPWNNSKRIQIAKERTRRMKKRKRDKSSSIQMT
jgi:hypothetical protein